MIGSELPKGWKEVKLSDLAEIQSGGTPSRSNSAYWNGDIPWVKISDIKGKYVTETEEFITEEGLMNSSAKVFERGTILFSIFATIGKVAILDIDATTNQALVGLKINEFVDKSFLVYALIELSERISNLGKGVAQKNINISILKDVRIPLPPLTEQKQIAEKLDKLFDQIETIKEASNKIPELLKNFRQQVLTYAVTGKLTERWRIENEIGNEFLSIETDNHRDYNYNIPDTWKLLSFSNVVSIESNLVNPNDYKDYPLIAPDNIESMTGRILSKPTVAEIAPKSSKHYFTKDSLVYSKIRPYLSKIAYVDFDGLCSADMYPLKTKLNIFYLYYYMLSSEFLSFATTAGERIVLPKINQKSLNIIPVPVPSLKEQEEIAKRVQTLFDILDDVERRYNTLCEKLDKLPQALLCKAFKGELV